VDGQFALEDLGSSNGCWVSGNKIAGKHILRDGDLVELGLWRATFSSGRSSEKEEPPPVALNKTAER
jgi:pSer/pThr/pTyr-binding forkhead associated (FHA) protein